MSTSTLLTDTLEVVQAGAPSAEGLAFTVPARHNPRLSRLAERISADEELRQLWRCANVNAVDRLGLGDCGEVHARIVANGALKLLRLLRAGGAVPGVVDQHRLTLDDAEVAVVLAAALHDLGLAAEASGEAAGLALAAIKGRELLTGLYGVRERTILLAEALHAIGAQPGGVPCLTLEAGVLRLADALDLSKGRVRLSADAVRGHSAAAPVEEVTITRAKRPPVRVIIRLRQPEGMEALEAMLLHRLRGSGLHQWVELTARLEGPGEDRLMPLRAWDAVPAEPA